MHHDGDGEVHDEVALVAQQYDNEVQHSDDECNMVQHSEVQHDDKVKHYDR